MTPDQISKLPPAIRLVADNLKHAGFLGEDDSYRLLTWGLQVQEERDAAQKRTIEEALVFYRDGIAECKLGDLIVYNSITGDDGDNEVVENFCRELNKRVAKCVPPVERELENFRKYEESLNSWSRKLETAEATIATLTRERNEARKWVKILHENGTFGRSCATALAEDGQLGDILLVADQLERSKAVDNAPR